MSSAGKDPAALVLSTWPRGVPTGATMAPATRARSATRRCRTSACCSAAPPSLQGIQSAAWDYNVH
jgi:hypothetical protein